MKVTLQRVSSANCVVDNHLISEIQKGYMLLIGFTKSDTIENVKKMAKKVANLRVFDDENGKMNLSIKDVNGEILAISQFTLYADTTAGNRPSFINCMNPEIADNLYNKFVEIIMNDYQIPIKKGVFGAHMYLNIVCDGPVTINMEF